MTHPAPALSPFALLLALSALAFGPHAWAERADKDKPMHIEADALRYDELHQTSLFSGGVVMTKGSILIRGQQVEVKQDAQGHQFGTVWAGPQQLAFFRQKRDVANEYMEGESQKIEYDGKADVVTFLGQAVLRRYRGTQLSDETAGDTIVYNNVTEVFRVEKGQNAGSASNPSGRVRATLSPKSTASAPETQPGLPLQNSPRLDNKP